MLLRWILSLVSLSLLCMAVPSAAEENLKTRRVQEAKAFVERYFKLEEARDYTRVYALLANVAKKEWRQTLNVRSALEYKKLREFQGLRWLNFKVKEEVSFDSQLNAIVGVTTEYEQRVLGEHVVYGKVDLAAIVVWENHKPLLDSIDLIKVH